ncbi:MAG TPA: type I DNA topoisomerase [Chloroflexota bacterium]|nr:type I DNA topoisomerase [Chloroflexota bacterium]
MKLVIVESPKKARTIAGFLGPGYRVAASMGHVRDLPAKGLGIDVGKDFAPLYEVLPRAGKALAALRKAAAGAEGVLLATDPDREGEAIAWHLVQALRLPRARYQRITFHEISRRAVTAALASPRALDAHLVDAQQARRVLDRLVGYELSPLLWRQVQRGTSAGRVQSVALRLVVDREREIAAFVPREYWTIDVRLRPQGESPPDGPAGEPDGAPFLARLETVDGRKAEIADETTARLLEGQLRGARYRVLERGQETVTRQPPPPFTTSTLQQTAGARLRLGAKRTMALAQALYEAGLVTYMRTDSVSVSDAAVDAARRLIGARFGAPYVPPSPRRYRTRSRNAQEAHEAIRPVEVERTPADLRPSLGGDEWRLYDLIWKRMVASQMAGARYTRDVALVEGVNERRFGLRATATTLTFPGWLAIYGQGAGATEAPPAQRGEEGAEDEGPGNERLPPLAPGQPLTLEDVLPAQHFTRPPPRYTEASLVKALEEAGVGRPSTYATVVTTIQDRGYVQVGAGAARRGPAPLVPTDLGNAACDFLVQHFPRIVDPPFTAEMESALDEIAGGRLAWTAMLHDFYAPFAETVGKARAARPAAGRPAAAQPTQRRPTAPGGAPQAGAGAGTCPQCGRPLVQRVSQFGPFLGCSGYPACRYVQREQGKREGRKPAGRPRTARPRRPASRPDSPSPRMPRPRRRLDQTIPADFPGGTTAEPQSAPRPAPRPARRPGRRQPEAPGPAPRARGRSRAPSPRGSHWDGSRPATPEE